MNELPPLGNAEEKKHIIFATEDETTGMVLVGWRGPNVLVCTSGLFEHYTDLKKYH